MGRGILQPKTKIFPHLFYRDIDVFAKKNNSLTLKKKIKGNMTICERFLSKNFVPSPIPNGRGRILSLFHNFFAKNIACFCIASVIICVLRIYGDIWRFFKIF